MEGQEKVNKDLFLLNGAGVWVLIFLFIFIHCVAHVDVRGQLVEVSSLYCVGSGR